MPDVMVSVSVQVVEAAERAGLSVQAWVDRALDDALELEDFESSAGVAVLAARLDVGVPSRSAFVDRRQRAGGRS